MVASRTQCSWTNTLRAGVISALEYFLAVFLEVVLGGVFDNVLASFLLSSLQLSLSLLLDEACIVKMSVNFYSA